MVDQDVSLVGIVLTEEEQTSARIRKSPFYQSAIQQLKCQTQVDISEQQRIGVRPLDELNLTRDIRAQNLIDGLRAFERIKVPPSIEQQEKYSAICQALKDSGYDPFKSVI